MFYKPSLTSYGSGDVGSLQHLNIGGKTLEILFNANT